MATQKHKQNALLGGLLVFLVPIIAVSVVYFSASRLPKGKELPILQTQESIGDWQFVSADDTIMNGSFWKDVKLIFKVDSTTIDKRVELLSNITEDTKSHPEFSLKDPYGQVYFVAVMNSYMPTPEDLHHWFFVQEEVSSPAFQADAIYLLDRNENLRGQYSFTFEEIAELDRDVQYLLQDTYYDNADSLRIKTVFKRELDEE